MFGIPDLVPALVHFLTHVQIDGSKATFTVGSQQPVSTSNTPLLFQKIEVWPGLCIQMKDIHNPHIIHPPETLCAWSPSRAWPLGHCDNILINVDLGKEWPHSSISGK